MTDATTDASFTTGSAIEIASNNVALDLNGHKVQGLAAGPGTNAFGIHAFQRNNITIKNGTVRGFEIGIFLEDVEPFTISQSHRVEGVRADHNRFVGIDLHGLGSIVRGNQVVATGGASFMTNGVGIGTSGAGARIVDNDVIDTAGSGGGVAVGIAINAGNGSVVEGNRVGNQTSPGSGSHGIEIAPLLTVLVVGNRVVAWDTGVSYGGGNPTTRCRDNFFSGIVTEILHNCTDVGNNN